VILGRLSYLLLLAACSVIPATGSPHPSRPRDAGCCIERPTLTRLNTPAPASARPYGISPFSPWRYRLKTVLPETDSWITQESDLGTVPLLDRLYSSVVQTRSLDLSPTAVPLRC
jgi:hypothetical protein